MVKVGGNEIHAKYVKRRKFTKSEENAKPGGNASLPQRAMDAPGHTPSHADIVCALIDLWFSTHL